MWQMFFNSARLFMQGKLFRDKHAVLKQWLVGFAVSAVLLIVVGWLTTPLVGVLAASIVGGGLQPYLFKDLKYA